MKTFTNMEKLEAVIRELGYRKRVYENRVSQGKMSNELATRQIELFEAIKRDYEALERGERLI